VMSFKVSGFRSIEPSLFPMRYCYCLTNRTNDLTDFTAVLLDFMENSTSYLQELFKSKSISSGK
ncbi:HHLA1 protein, partial [Amia calva]|nr:HHLA1 protein [Amia calva]